MTEEFPIIRIEKENARYSKLLQQIADPPAVLYCRGNLALLDTFCIAIVGTRKVSDYGRQAGADLAGNLAIVGITVVSGLALGVDAIAHRAALDAAGATIAVLGGGPDDATIGPSSNRPLARDILCSSGLIVSEYAPGTPAHPGSFPVRNRIISGLSRGVLVIEANRQSGSLITARCALDQNRDVFAVPGSIYWPRSVGTNWLIRQGAHPVMTAANLIEYYKMCQDSLPEAAVSTDDPVQAGILALLRESGPTHLDNIVAAVDAEPSRAMAAVALLELKGVLIHQDNGTYAVKPI